MRCGTGGCRPPRSTACSAPYRSITRDAIAVEWAWHGRPVRLVDTAGMRRRARIEARLERLSVADTLRAVRYAETVILVIDALQPLERQDLTIANLVADEGRAIGSAAAEAFRVVVIDDDEDEGPG